MYSPQMHSDVKEYFENSSVAMVSGYQSLKFYSEKLGVPLEELRIRGRVLDVGCGPGIVTRVFYDYLDSSASLDGCDISNVVLDKAKKHNQDKNINFFLLDANRESESLVNTYDFIFSNFMLHWIPDHRPVLKNFYSMLKPFGSSLMCFFSHQPIWDSYRDLSKMPKWNSFMKDVENYMTPYQDDKNADVTFEKLLIECGFKKADVAVVELDCSKKYYTYGGLRNNFIAVDPFLPKMPVEEKESYMNDLMEAYARNKGYKNMDSDVSLQNDDYVDVTGDVLIALAYK